MFEMIWLYEEPEQGKHMFNGWLLFQVKICITSMLLFELKMYFLYAAILLNIWNSRFYQLLNVKHKSKADTYCNKWPSYMAYHCVLTTRGFSAKKETKTRIHCNYNVHSAMIFITRMNKFFFWCIKGVLIEQMQLRCKM